MIIIEGCDNTGKTTLKERILKVKSGAVSGPKQTRPPEDPQAYMERLWEILMKPNTDGMVFDRFYFSELVYGPLFRGKVSFTPTERVLIEKMLKKHNPLIIYCHRAPERIIERIYEREQLHGLEEKIPKIIERYNEIFLPWAEAGYVTVYDIDNPLTAITTWKEIDKYFYLRSGKVVTA